MAVVSLACAACGTASEPSQLVAKGRNFELSASEADIVFGQAPTVAKDQVKPARARILDALITQKLFAQAAIDQRLDHDVAVMQAIEDAKRRILANAYVDRLSRSDAEPTDREMLRYYEGHPAMFAQRRIYTITQYQLPAQSAAVGAYRAALDSGGLLGLDARLAQDGLSAHPTNLIIGSETLPDAVNRELGTLHPGATVSFTTESGYHLGIIASIQDGSIPIDGARMRIKALIEQERRAAVVRSQGQTLRAQRQIEIVDPGLRSS